MKLLKQLYEIHSPSRGEKRLKQFIKRYISQHITDCKIEYDEIGNMYITKGKSETYPCLAAHLDQVQMTHSRNFRAVETQDIIFGYSRANRRQEGLGADDKNGIWVALKCLEKYENLKVALFVQEEIGCIGSSNAELAFFEDCRFVVQCDRRGYSDMVCEIGWQRLCSEEFIRDIAPENFGYKTTDGMITDVGELKQQGLNISCLNLSCGYYEPHSDSKFTVKRDLLNCLALVEHIIENCTEVYLHEDEEADYEMQSYKWYDEYETLSLLIADSLELDPMLSADDLWSQHSDKFSQLEKSDFEEITDTTNRQFFNF